MESVKSQFKKPLKLFFDGFLLPSKTKTLKATRFYFFIAFFMLLPVTTTSQSLLDIINNAQDKDIIRLLIKDWYERFTIEETDTPVYKDTRAPASSTTSTRVWVWGIFNLIRTHDIQLVADKDTNLILDINQE